MGKRIMATRSIVSLGILVFFAGQPLVGAVRGEKAIYVGGTLTLVPEGTVGRFDLTSDTSASFRSGKGQVLFEIPFRRVNSLEYGQKAGQSVAGAVAATCCGSEKSVSGTIGLAGGSRRHFLSIGFTDWQNKKQGVVLELAPGTVRTTLVGLEVKTGLKAVYQSEDARKHVD